MPAQADIEAAIDRDPNDVAAYEVYADWLSGNGDPRGELIAAQIAARRAPADKKLVKRANATLLRLESTLLGPQLARLGTDLICEWYLGFLRAVRLRGDYPSARLRTLVHHPSARFLQSIAVLAFDARPEPIVKLLCAEKRPPLLDELRVGATPLDDAHLRRLRLVFPHYGSGRAMDWFRIIQRLAGERRTDLGYDLDALPDLEPRPGVDVTGVTPELIARAFKLDHAGTETGIAAAMKASYTPESLDRFAAVIADQFFAKDQRDAMRWGFDLLGLYGDAVSLRWIVERFPRCSHPRAHQMVQMLGRIGSPRAIATLHLLATNPAFLADRRGEALRKLDDLADARGITREELVASVPVDDDAPVAATPAIVRGTRARIARGKNREHEGTVFWVGEGSKHGRLGLHTDAGETIWANVADVQPL